MGGSKLEASTGKKHVMLFARSLQLINNKGDLWAFAKSKRFSDPDGVSASVKNFPGRTGGARIGEALFFQLLYSPLAF